jgi:hypothetical protein
MTKQHIILVFIKFCVLFPICNDLEGLGYRVWLQEKATAIFDYSNGHTIAKDADSSCVLCTATCCFWIACDFVFPCGYPIYCW